MVERKGSVIYTSCAEVGLPTKMLCIPMSSVATLNMSLPSNIMFCGLFLTIWKQLNNIKLINSWGYLLSDLFQLPLRIGPPYRSMPASQTYMYYPLKVEGIMRPVTPNFVLPGNGPVDLIRLPKMVLLCLFWSVRQTTLGSLFLSKIKE